MRAVLPNLIFILPAVTLQRRILIFWFGPLGGLYECLEMLQGVWGRVPVGLVSIVMYAVLAGLACGVVRHESFELAGLRGWPAIILYAKVSTLS